MPEESDYIPEGHGYMVEECNDFSGHNVWLAAHLQHHPGSEPTSLKPKLTRTRKTHKWPPWAGACVKQQHIPLPYPIPQFTTLLDIFSNF